MGLGSIFSFFRKKKKDEPDLSDIPDFPKDDVMSAGISKPVAPPQAAEGYGTPDENIRARIDLMATHLESIKIQYESLNEKVGQIEKMVKELVNMARSG